MSSSPSVTPDPYAAFRIPAYRMYASAWMLAVIGTQAQSVALGWDLYNKTHDALVLGMVGLLQAIPLIALAIPAGQLADRFDRRKILIASQAASFFTCLGLMLCSYYGAPVQAYYALLFLDGTANAIGWPARSAMLPLLVPLDKLANAVTWNSTLFQFASVTGPAIGGLILIRSVPATYSLHLFAALWYIVCLTRIRTTPQTYSREPLSLHSVMAGLRFVFDQKIILATISLDLFAVLLGGATYLLPAVAANVLHVGSFGFGMLRAAPAIGAVCMAMVLAHLPPMKHAGRAMLLAVAGFGAATIVFGLSTNFLLSLVALLFTGVFDNVSVVVRHTLVQVLTPDNMRGRVGAVNTVFIGSSNELGGFESGLTARLFGLTASIVYGGIGTLIVVAGIDRLFPQVRAFGALDQSALATPDTSESETEVAQQT